MRSLSCYTEGTHDQTKVSLIQYILLFLCEENRWMLVRSKSGAIFSRRTSVTVCVYRFVLLVALKAFCNPVYTPHIIQCISLLWGKKRRNMNISRTVSVCNRPWNKEKKRQEESKLKAEIELNRIPCPPVLRHPFAFYLLCYSSLSPLSSSVAPKSWPRFITLYFLPTSFPTLSASITSFTCVSLSQPHISVYNLAEKVNNETLTISLKDAVR